MEQPDIKDIMLCLGKIEGALTAINEQRSKENQRITLALIGIIAAQIGVKIMGSPILLDIATILAFVGVALAIGFLFLGLRIHRKMPNLTKSGWALAVMILMITLTQALVYLRDLGYIDPDLVYFVRIPQNLSIIVFLWFIFAERKIYHNEKDVNDKK